MIVKEMYIIIKDKMYMIVKDHSIKLVKEFLHYTINAILVYITFYLGLCPEYNFVAWETACKNFDIQKTAYKIRYIF